MKHEPEGREDQGFTALPARATTVVACIDAMAKVKAPATVRRYVSSIATMHKAMARAAVRNR